MSALSVPSRPLPAPGASLSLPSWSRPIPSLSVCGSGPMSGSSGQLSIGTAALCPPHPQLSCCLSDTPALSPCTPMHRGITPVSILLPRVCLFPQPLPLPLSCAPCGTAVQLPICLSCWLPFQSLLLFIPYAPQRMLAQPPSLRLSPAPSLPSALCASMHHGTAPRPSTCPPGPCLSAQPHPAAPHTAPRLRGGGPDPLVVPVLPQVSPELYPAPEPDPLLPRLPPDLHPARAGRRGPAEQLLHHQPDGGAAARP